MSKVLAVDRGVGKGSGKEFLLSDQCSWDEIWFVKSWDHAEAVGRGQKAYVCKRTESKSPWPF